MAAIEDNSLLRAYKLNSSTILGIFVVSVVYFADIFLKASHKCFWFDELFTTYLCRLPNFSTTWAAVGHGADFNPPLLYLLTHFVQWLFGEGLIATRLPAMVGVWAFGVCLFLFVARRAGAIAGFIAGTFPFFTLAQYYAYEARAHGIVLGWCGLTLVCWQRYAEGRGKYLWLAGFGLCLVGALLTHVYAVYLLVPFALVELYNVLRARQPNWAIVGVMLLAFGSVTVAVYLPLFRVYRTMVPSTFFPGAHDLVQRFLVNAIGPAIVILLLSLFLSALDGVRLAEHANRPATIPRREIVLAVGFASIPLVGLLGSKVSHGPFIERYFLSSVAGYALFLAFATSRRQVGSWVAKVLAGSMFFLMLADLGATAYLGTRHRIVLIEPSTGLTLTTTPSTPMVLYDSLLNDKSALDVLVFPSLEYLYLFKYAPPAVVHRLYYGGPADDVNLGGYKRLVSRAHIDLQLTTIDQFLSSRSRFLVYESSNSAHVEEVQALLSAGYRPIFAKVDVGGTLYEYEK